MSWCRWSSMDWVCDLYVYESEAGVEIHVARRRVVVEPGELPDPIDPTEPGWYERREQVRQIVQAAPSVDIGLPYDGESYIASDLDEAADLVDMLVEVGYIAPPHMASEMRAEAGEVER